MFFYLVCQGWLIWKIIIVQVWVASPISSEVWLQFVYCPGLSLTVSSDREFHIPLWSRRSGVCSQLLSGFGVFHCALLWYHWLFWTSALMNMHCEHLQSWLYCFVIYKQRYTVVPSYHLHGHNLQNVSTAKYLGVNIYKTNWIGDST